MQVKGSTKTKPQFILFTCLVLSTNVWWWYLVRFRSVRKEFPLLLNATPEAFNKLPSKLSDVLKLSVGVHCFTAEARVWLNSLKNTFRHVCWLLCQKMAPHCHGNRGSMICSPHIKRTHLERISCLWLHGGSSNDSHVVSSSHSNLALLNSVCSRGPCSSLQPPTEKVSEFTDAAPTTLHKNMIVITAWCRGYIRL